MLMCYDHCCVLHPCPLSCIIQASRKFSSLTLPFYLMPPLTIDLVLCITFLLHYKVIFISHMLSLHSMFCDSRQMDILLMHFKEMNHTQTSEYISRLYFYLLTTSYHNINLKDSFFSFCFLAMVAIECASNFILFSVLLRCTLDLLRQVRKQG